MSYVLELQNTTENRVSGTAAISTLSSLDLCRPPSQLTLWFCY